jgi:hypothetical protein
LTSRHLRINVDPIIDLTTLRRCRGDDLQLLLARVKVGAHLRRNDPVRRVKLARRISGRKSHIVLNFGEHTFIVDDLIAADTQQKEQECAGT